MSILTYKGYSGVFDYDDDGDIFHGEVINIADVVTFEGRSIDELKQALKDSIEDYLDFCAKENRKPQKPFSGRFNVRINPHLHERIVIKAAQDGKSLNNWIADTLENAV